MASGADRQLRKTLLFDEQELAANRQGHILASQKNLARYVPGWWGGFIYLIPLVLMFACILGEGDVISAGVAGVVFVAGFSMLILVQSASLWRLQRIMHDLRHENVAVTVGIIQRGEGIRRGKMRMRVNELDFEVDPAVYAVFEDTASYHIYYLPNSMTILSAERAYWEDNTSDAGTSVS
jgi:hypothetical protein